MSVLPARAKTEVFVKTWRVGISAHVLMASLATIVRLTLMSATAPPV